MPVKYQITWGEACNINLSKTKSICVI